MPKVKYFGDAGFSYVLAPSRGLSVESKPMEGLECVSVHKVLRDRTLLGTVWVFDEGMRRLGFSKPESLFPLDVSKLVGEDGAMMLEKLTEERLHFGGGSLVSLRSDGLDEGGLRRYHRIGAGLSLNDREGFGHDEGFRKYSLVWRNASGKLQWVDLKVPGQELAHYNVEPVNFFAAVKIFQEFLKAGETPLMACPLMLVNIPPTIPQRLYGETRTQNAAQLASASGVPGVLYEERPDRPAAGSLFSSNYMILEHLEGMRLVRKGKAITPDREIIPWLYVQNVARKNSMGLDEVVYGMTAAPFKFARFAHAACYFLDDDRHHGNFMLCTDGVTKSVSDLGSVYEMNSLESHRVDDILRIIINHTTFLSKLPAQFQRLERSPYLEYPDDEVLEKSIGVALKVLGPR